MKYNILQFINCINRILKKKPDNWGDDILPRGGGREAEGCMGGGGSDEKNSVPKGGNIINGGDGAPKLLFSRLSKN